MEMNNIHRHPPLSELFSLCFQLHPQPHSKHAWRALMPSLHCALFLECSVPTYIHGSIFPLLQGFVLRVLSLARPSLTYQEYSQGKALLCKHEDLSLDPQSQVKILASVIPVMERREAETSGSLEACWNPLSRFGRVTGASKRPCLKQKVEGT